VSVESIDQARERLRPYVERARRATGWSFDVHARVLESRAWDYDQHARDLLSRASVALDIGTGGGKRFYGYCESYRGRAVATEGWHINAPIASRTLRPLGIELVHCADTHLPFMDGVFDTILNRHSGFSPEEIGRLLKPGGIFYTEQVWDHWRELKRFFPRMVEYRGACACRPGCIQAPGRIRLHGLGRFLDDS
jgi:SAM-dependent methyltransferase